MELERAANRLAVVAHRMPVRVAGAAESAEIDAAAIASGIPSRALMRVAAANAATVIAARAARGERGARSGGVIVYTGRGNNGGDGWAVARSLAMAGCHVVVREIVSAATPDAIAERDAYRACCANASDDEYSGSVIVDAMLGTGSAGEPRGAIAAAVNAVNALRSRGATVVSLDVPTGLDATSGAGELTVHADLTLNFGTCKRGALAARGRCGELIVLDIGLETNDEQLPLLVDVEYVRANVPKVPATAHKGTRGKLAVVAGARGMGGAAILAAKGALLSGIGLLKVVTDDCNVTSVHAQVPEALTGSLTDAAGAIAGWADAVLIGPGLGHDANARALVLDILQAWRGPVVVDADALNVFDNNVAALASLLAGRPALITPHPAELGRLLGRDVEDVLANRFDIAVEVARTLGATVLLKGTPTVITTAEGARYVVARGTPVLATGGSGDALGGMIATLVAQRSAPPQAAACAAWVHGRAAELTPGVRGFALSDVLDRLSEAWRLDDVAARMYPVLAALPAVS